MEDLLDGRYKKSKMKLGMSIQFQSKAPGSKASESHKLQNRRLLGESRDRSNLASMCEETIVAPTSCRVVIVINNTIFGKDSTSATKQEEN
jgi:hypothetical protein